MRRLAAIIAVCVVVFGVGLTVARAEKRVALVIGNSTYRNTTPLKNPSNDATAMSAALERLGFTVVRGIDLDYPGMREHVKRFAEALVGADVGLFFYAGHGLQVGGQNFLAPIEVTLNSEAELDFNTVSLNLILRQMEREARTNLVFLDACRDNPLARNLARSMGTRSADVSRGLARVESGIGTLIAFATQPGNVALDGDGENSPFTSAILDHIDEPGQDINRLMIAVRRSVIETTKSRQVPWEHSSLTGSFYFKPPDPQSATAASVRNEELTAKAQLAALEVTFWKSVEGSSNPRLFESYLNRYPKGTFSELARLKIEELSAPAKTAPAPQADDSEAVGKGDLAKELQERLYELNYDPGPLDGQIGERTREAVREFQAQSQLDKTGTATLGLLRRLRNLGGLKPWGAIVYSSSRENWGMSWNHTTRKAAVKEAQSSCGDAAHACEAELTFFGTECGAFAHSDKGWAIVARNSIDQAKAAALDDCKAQGGDCRIVATVCADGADQQVAAK